MKMCEIFNEAFGTSRVGTMNITCGCASPAALEIAQRFSAGFRLRESSKSRQGRQNRCCLWTLLSSLTGLHHLDHVIFPALKRSAIFGSTDGPQRDNLRLAS
jgi:hypothetical protein